MSEAYGWESLRLGDFADLTVGATPSRSVSRYWGNENSGYPWVSIADLRSGTVSGTSEYITDAGVRGSPVSRVSPGTILMSFKLTIGRVAIAGADLYTNEAIVAIDPDQLRIDKGWLAHVLPRVASAEISDSAVKGDTLNQKKLRSLKFSVPPLLEQRRIAEVFDAVDEAIDSSAFCAEKLDLVRGGLISSLLYEGLSGEDGPLRISEIGDVFSGGTPSRDAGSRYFSINGIPWVKTLDLNESVVSSTDEAITRAAIEESACFVLPAGTVLVAMYGGWVQIGRTGIMGVPAAVNQAISAIRVRRKDVIPEYLLLALQAFRFKWKSLAASTRKDPNLTKSDVLNFQLPVPGEEEQRRIVSIVKAHDERIAAEKARLEKLCKLKAGLMDDLLTGRVRVDQLDELPV